MKTVRILVLSCALISSLVASAAETTVASATTTATAMTTAPTVTDTPAEAQGASTTTAQPTEKKSALDSIYFGLTSTFHGAGIENLGAAQTVSTRGIQNPSSKASNFTNLYFDSEANTGYMLNKNVGIGAVVPFFYIPVNGEAFVLGDVGVKVSNKHLIQNGRFNLSANLILQGATSTSSSDRKMKIGYKSTPAMSYNVPKSNLTIGSFNELKYYSGVVNDKTFKLWTLPYLRYSLSDKFALNVSYEMEWHHNVGQTGYLTFTTYQTDIQPGFVWNITPKIMVNPYLSVNTMDYVSTNRTSVGAFMSAAVL